MHVSTQTRATFTKETKASFLEYLRENPNTRRVSRQERENIIQWLTNPLKRPASQSEFSRRNYVRRTFIWDQERQLLAAIPKTESGQNRLVITEDLIADKVERVHESNGHAGWDYTWKDVSNSYHGILRSDVIHLLKQCQTCAHNPSKRPKRSDVVPTDPHAIDEEFIDFVNYSDLLSDDSTQEWPNIQK